MGTIIGLVGCLVVVSMLVISSPRTGQTTPAPVIRLDPASVKLIGIAGEEFTLDMIIDGAVNLGGFEARITFDPQFIKFIKFDEQPFLNLTERPANCEQRKISESSAELRCNTEGEEPSGPSGKLVVARLKFSVRGLLVGKTTLLVTSCNATDVFGKSIEIKTCKGTNITINQVTPTPTNTQTATATSPPTATATPTATPHPRPTTSQGAALTKSSRKKRLT